MINCKLIVKAHLDDWGLHTSEAPIRSRLPYCAVTVTMSRLLCLQQVQRLSVLYTAITPQTCFSWYLGQTIFHPPDKLTCDAEIVIVLPTINHQVCLGHQYMSHYGQSALTACLVAFCYVIHMIAIVIRACVLFPPWCTVMNSLTVCNGATLVHIFPQRVSDVLFGIWKAPEGVLV